MLPWDYCARSEDTGQCVLMRPQSRLLARVPRPKPFACITNQWSQTAAHPGAELIQGQKALKGWVFLFARCATASDCLPLQQSALLWSLTSRRQGGCGDVFESGTKQQTVVGHAVLVTELF